MVQIRGHNSIGASFGSTTGSGNASRRWPRKGSIHPSQGIALQPLHHAISHKMIKFIVTLFLWISLDLRCRMGLGLALRFGVGGLCVG